MGCTAQGRPFTAQGLGMTDDSSRAPPLSPAPHRTGQAAPGTPARADGALWWSPLHPPLALSACSACPSLWAGGERGVGLVPRPASSFSRPPWEQLAAQGHPPLASWGGRVPSGLTPLLLQGLFPQWSQEKVSFIKHFAGTQPPGNAPSPQETGRERDVLGMGPGSHSGGMQREGPGPGATGAKCRRSDFTLVLIRGPSQQPTELRGNHLRRA